MRVLDRLFRELREFRSPLFLIPILCFFALRPSATVVASHPDGSPDPSPETSTTRIVQSPDGEVAPPAWWNQASETLRQLEYRVSESAHGLQAPSRSQGLRIHFRTHGIGVGPRSGGENDWKWGWQTSDWGRAGTTMSLGSQPGAGTPPQRTADPYRVEYRHDGLLEWYENGPSGLEQGFLVEQRPPGDGDLLIRGIISGDLAADEIRATGDIRFLTSHAVPALDYAGLCVEDATGRELPAEIEVDEDYLVIRIDDSDAVFPVLVDPMITAPEWTYDPDQADSNFGHAVSTAGDVNGDGYSDLLIGAMRYDSGHSNEGGAFLFLGSPDGLAAAPAWIGGSNQQNALYGSDVSTAGDVNGDGYDDVIVGAHFYDNGHDQEGRAYLYLGSPSGLTHDADWTAEADQIGASFGTSVSTAGDINGDGYADVVVGANNYSNGQNREGAVFLYYGSSTGPSPTADWVGDSDDEFANFGASVSGAGDVNGDGYADLLVGAYSYDAGAIPGRAFAYLGSSSGLGSSPDWEVGTETDESEQFGWSVAAAGDVDGDGYADVLVGAPLYSAPGLSRGRACLYRGSASGLASSPSWEQIGDVNFARFGDKVATAGDVNGDGYADVLVGAETYTHGESEEGRAYLYLGSFSGLSSSPIWMTESDQADASYAGSVATAGDVNGDGYSDIVVGSEWYDDPEFAEGKAFVFHGSPDGPRTEAGWVTESNQAEARYGYSVASAGDVNADGFSDVLVGARGYDNGESFEGAAFLFLGTSTGLSALPAWYAEGNQVQAGLGTSVGTAGDVNGDGLEDLLIGASEYTEDFAGEGAAFVWYSVIGGGPPGTPATADWSTFGGQAGARFGFSASTAGDVNGDGFADVIVGAFDYDNGQVDEGGAWVFHGSEAGLSEDPDWFHDSGHTDASYGVSVSSAGDFNGDGFSDVIIGAFTYDHPTPGEGAAFVYLGSEDGIVPGAPVWFAEGNQVDAWFGLSVACAGDVNGDGFSDVLIGAPKMNTPAPSGGAAYLWHGAESFPTSGAPGNEDWSSSRNQAGALLGRSVASAGDVNGDGFSDIIVGCPANSTDPSGNGAAFLWFGSVDGVITGAADWIAEGTQSSAVFGWTVASAGDVNGDGFCDVLVGASDFDMGQNNEGRAYLYYGNSSRGLARVPQQWEIDASEPIAPYGMSEDETRFLLAARGRAAAGRSVVRLLYEVREHGEPFDGTALHTGAWVLTGVPVNPGGSSALLLGLATGLTDGHLYKWRMRFETTNPLFPRTPWLYHPGNGGGEADLRMAPGASDVELQAFDADGNIGLPSPNPFQSETSIRWSLQEDATVRISIHDIQGRLVRNLVSVRREAGSHHSTWDGTDERGNEAPVGVYWIRISIDDRQQTRKVVRVE